MSELETKFFNLELKADGEERVISGYGSIFGNEDRGGDVVARGAFSKSLASGRMVRMLFQHWPDEVIGKWTSIVEDEKGLKIEGVLADTQRGNELYKLLKMGALDGLSIGYRTLDVEYEGDVRVIKEAELWEVSVVTFPMNEAATVESVKTDEMTERDFERKLRDAGFSRKEAKALLSGGFDAVKGLRDADADGDGELVGLLNRIGQLNSKSATGKNL